MSNFGLHEQSSKLAEIATGRDKDLFQQDWDARRSELERAIGGRRLLVIGGAGSIGSAVVQLLTDFEPESVHVVDQNENNLAELVRDLRSRERGLEVRDFRALPIDFGSSIMRRFLAHERPYDLILNFAALKHVRSEKDVCSILQMLNTNVIKPWRFLEWIRDTQPEAAYFSISTDKAANPANLMGASKRLMEHVMFVASPPARRASSRFANVAFSDGSLLASFVKRIEKHQPLACPQGTRRFFVSLREAAEICILSAICGPTRSIVIPRMDMRLDLRPVNEIAANFLRLRGFEPQYYVEEREARARVDADVICCRYPLLLTKLDTTGEKPYEEFVGTGETTQEFGMSSLLAIPYKPVAETLVSGFVDAIDTIIRDPLNSPSADKQTVVRMIAEVIPELHHDERGDNLDQRM